MLKYFFKGNVLSLVGGIFGLVGSIFVVVAAGMGISTYKNMLGMERTYGKVIDEKPYSSGPNEIASYTPVILYTDHNGDDQEFSPNFGSNPPLFRKGQRVGMLIDPQGEKAPLVDHWLILWLMPGIFGTLGSLFVIVGGSTFSYSMFSDVRQQANKGWAQQMGRPVEAQITGAHQDVSLTTSMSAPYVITDQWMDPVTSTIYTFQSEPLLFNPHEYIKDRKTITVRIDPNNPKKRYWVDTSFLPKEA